MNTTEQTISKNSIWLTATPAPFAQTLPFYLTEAGIFEANGGYAVSRDGSKGFLLFYTLKKSGVLEQNGRVITLPENHAVILDCSLPHYYHAGKDGWDFIWLYANGNGMRAMFDIIYPNGIFAVDTHDDMDFRSVFPRISAMIRDNDMKSFADMSLALHSIVNSVLCAALNGEHGARGADFYNNMSNVVSYIKKCYKYPITLDDMLKYVHVSKYHFIRTFKRSMGVTPYQYLTAYRINEAKNLLRTTDISVGEIAESCGFCDASNFVAQFKKHTGQKPLQYRHDFSL